MVGCRFRTMREAINHLKTVHEKEVHMQSLTFIISSCGSKKKKLKLIQIMYRCVLLRLLKCISITTTTVIEAEDIS